MPRRDELIKTSWEAAREMIPGTPGDPGRAGSDNRRFINAVLNVECTGIPLRDLPERYGIWNSVWRRFDRWCAKDVWTRMAAVLGKPDLEELYLDSTSVKAHPSAAGSLRQAGEKKLKRFKGANLVVNAAD